MKNNIYVVFDRLASVVVFTFTAASDDLSKRLVRSALQDPHPNPINTDTADKTVYQIGSFDDEELEVKPCKRVAYSVEEVRQELIELISSHIETLKPALENLERRLEDVKTGKDNIVDPREHADKKL